MHSCASCADAAIMTYKDLFRRFFNLLNSFGLYNKNAKILFLVSPLVLSWVDCSTEILELSLLRYALKLFDEAELATGSRQCWEDDADGEAHKGSASAVPTYTARDFGGTRGFLRGVSSTHTLPCRPKPESCDLSGCLVSLADNFMLDAGTANCWNQLQGI